MPNLKEMLKKPTQSPVAEMIRYWKNKRKE